MNRPATAYDETDGGWNADDYAHNARFVADLAASLVDWLAPTAGERILDLGCGDGALTEVIVGRGADVVGLDRSPALAAAARERGLDVRVGDGQSLSGNAELGGDFDAVFSNAALHWMHRDPAAVIAGVFDRLRPGGRFVAEFGAEGNIAPIHAALRAEAAAHGRDPDHLDPWYFPPEQDYIKQLQAAGFVVEAQQCFERPTPLPGDISAWLATLARPFVNAFDAGAPRAAYIAAVRERLLPLLQNADGSWSAPYVRLRFIARKP